MMGGQSSGFSSSELNTSHWMVVPKLMFARTMNVQCINKMNETNKHVWVIYIEFQR